ncbi:hypothetical protein N8987_05200 [Crocinitomix sp.]|nr:hypothetical protein [Crocinitomix sp.]
MKQVLLFFFLIHVSLNLNAADTARVQKGHMISFEMGLYHRGTFGFGYHYFLKANQNGSFYTLSASFGTKYPWVFPNMDLYLNTALARNTPVGKGYFIYGLSFKRIVVPYWSDLFLSQSYKEFNDFTYGAFIGIGTAWFDNFSMQYRFSYTRSFNQLQNPAPWYNTEINYFSAFGVGVSLLYNL